MTVYKVIVNHWQCLFTRMVGFDFILHPLNIGLKLFEFIIFVFRNISLSTAFLIILKFTIN